MEVRQLVYVKEMQPDYGYDEAIRTLRTNLQFSGKDIKVVMLTSALPDEGKSDVSFSLAQSLAQIGKKTILVDTDIRKSVMVQHLKFKGELEGLSQYLNGHCGLPDIVLETNIDRLHIIHAGRFAPNPAELLESKECERMFEVLRQVYDYIIIDTPPMGNLADGAIVARYCDGAIIVVESGAISYHLEQKVKGQLEKTGCRLLGAVLNKVDIRGKSYYGKYGRYGKYGQYQYGKYGEPYGKQ